MLKIVKMENNQPKRDLELAVVKQALFNAPRRQVEYMDMWEVSFDYPDLVSEVWVVECSAYLLPKIVPALIHRQMAEASIINTMDSVPELTNQEMLEYTTQVMGETVKALRELEDPIFTSGVIKDWLDIMETLQVNDKLEMTYTVMGKQFPPVGVGVLDVLKREKRNLHTKKYDNLITYIEIPTDLNECDMVAHRTPSSRYADGAGDENYALPA